MSATTKNLPKQHYIGDKLSVQQRLFIYEYLKTGEPKVAAQHAGYKNHNAGNILLNPKINPHIVYEIEERMQVLAAKTELTAEYMRTYLLDILEADHSKHFKPSGANSWCIKADAWEKLPHKVKRLVEDIQYKEITTGIAPNQTKETLLFVRFISKTTAMVTAAKHVLTQKLLLAGEASLDFEEIARRVAEKRASRSIESKIEEVKQLAIAPPSPIVKTIVDSHLSNGDGHSNGNGNGHANGTNGNGKPH